MKGAGGTQLPRAKLLREPPYYFTFAPNEYLEYSSFSVLNLRSTEPASGRREYVSPNRQETVSVSIANLEHHPTPKG